MADVQIDQDAANIPAVNVIDQSSDPAAPGSGHAKLYVKDGTLYVRLDSGTVAPVGGSVALAEGRLAIGDGSDLISALALGSPGQVVTADGSGFATWDDLPAGAAATALGHVTILGHAYSAYSGTAPTHHSTASQPWNYYLSNDTQAQNDSVSYRLYLVPGTWTLRLFHMKAGSCGIVTVTLDATTLGTIDQYAGTLTYNLTSDIAGIVVAAGGLFTLTLTCATKNGSSSSYRYYLTAISLWRTA